MSSFNNLFEFRKKYVEFLNLLKKKIPSKNEYLESEFEKINQDKYLNTIANNYCSVIEGNNNYINYCPSWNGGIVFLFKKF